LEGAGLLRFIFRVVFLCRHFFSLGEMIVSSRRSLFAQPSQHKQAGRTGENYRHDYARNTTDPRVRKLLFIPIGKAESSSNPPSKGAMIDAFRQELLRGENF
jgi:hypothetical protein